MFAWMADHAVTIVTITVLFVIIAVAVYSLIKDKKRGSGRCTGNCATCGMGCATKKKS